MHLHVYLHLNQEDMYFDKDKKYKLFYHCLMEMS